MSPLRSIGNAISAFNDFYARTAGSASPGASDPVSATGGVKFTSGDYTYHFFTSQSPSPFTLSSGNLINVLVVGGGGGAMGDGSGGGGAGGIAHAENMPVSPGEFTATVGDRGNNSPITNGSGSTFVDPSGPTTITGLGGGAGKDSNPGSNGGSGGGGGQVNDPGGTGNQPSQNPGLSYVTNYGNDGGPGSGNDEGGGGGGAGGPGVAAGSGPTSGDGGNGQPFTFMPGPQLYTDMPSPLQSTLGTAWRDALGPTGLMAGGGGGGDDGDHAPYGEPGPGGGGNGGPGSDAVNYTGSGGGGGSSSPNRAGGQGGIGLVVVYYPT
tara:strand:- start:211 stop:1179 length:969 start_codon:yes stop_codon:yes gene_type:complete